MENPPYTYTYTQSKIQTLAHSHILLAHITYALTSHIQYTCKQTPKKLHTYTLGINTLTH